MDKAAVDLNGYHVSGVSAAGILFGADSSSDGFKEPGGSITVSGSTVAAVSEVGGKDYVGIGNDGTYQFWRFAIMPTDCRFYFKPSSHSHLAYKVTVRGHENILKHLSDVSLSATDGTATSSHSYKEENGGSLPTADQGWISCILLDLSKDEYTTAFAVTATATFDQTGTVTGTTTGFSLDDNPASAVTDTVTPNNWTLPTE